MALTKKEKELIEKLKTENALRLTEDVPFDVPPPQYNERDSVGWTYNIYTLEVRRMISSSISHWPDVEMSRISRSQGAISMYSTRLKALKAMRREKEKQCAGEIRAIDKMIENEILNNQEGK